MTTVRIAELDSEVGRISVAGDELRMVGNVGQLTSIVDRYYEGGDLREFVRTLPHRFKSRVFATIVRDDESDAT